MKNMMLEGDPKNQPGDWRQSSFSNFLEGKGIRDEIFHL